MLNINTTLYHLQDYVKDAVSSFVQQNTVYDLIKEQRALPFLHQVRVDRTKTGSRILMRSNTWGALWLELDAMDRLVGTEFIDAIHSWAAVTKKAEVSSTMRKNLKKWIQPGAPLEKGLEKIKAKSYLWGIQSHEKGKNSRFYLLQPTGMLRLDTVSESGKAELIESLTIFDRDEAVHHLDDVQVRAQDAITYQELA